MHPLAVGRSRQIEFVHFVDGEVHIFTSTLNDMSGDRMSYFDSEPPTMDDKNAAWAKSVFKDIEKKCEVLKDTGWIVIKDKPQVRKEVS